MADTKISALTAATVVADANEFAINEAGVSKKVTAAQILGYSNIIKSAITYYVCPAGQTTASYDGAGGVSVTPSDSNDGLTPTTPFATIQKVADTIRGKILLNVVTVQLADVDGSHAYLTSNVVFENICLGGPPVSFFDVGAGPVTETYPTGYIYLKGNTTTRANVKVTGASTFNGTTSTAVRGVVFSGCNARVRGIKFQYYGNTLNAADSGAIQAHNGLLYAEDLDYQSDKKGTLLIGWYHAVIKIGGTFNITDGNLIDVLGASTGEFATPLTTALTIVNVSMASGSYFNAVVSANSFAKIFLDHADFRFSGLGTFTAFNAYEGGNLYSNDCFGASKLKIDFNTCSNATFVEASQGASAFFIVGASNSVGTQTGNILRNNLCRNGAYIGHQNLFTATNADTITSGGRITSGVFPGTDSYEANFRGQSRQAVRFFEVCGSNAWENGVFQFNRGRGTLASPSVVQSGDDLGTFNFCGWNSANYGAVARIYAEAVETFSGSTGAGRIHLATQSPGGVDNPTDRFRIDEFGELTALASRGVQSVWIGVANSNVTPVTVNANSTSAQNLMSWAVPAGGLNKLLKSLRVFCRGLYTTQSAQTPTMTFTLKLGSVTLATWLTTATTASVTNLAWQIEAWLTTATIGASGNLEGHGQLQVRLGTGAGASTDFLDTNTAVSSNLDLTASQTLQLTVTFSTNAASANSCSQRQMIVEVMN
jgi:hypothetical protein